MEITTLNANKTLNFYSLLLGLTALLFILTPLVSAAGLTEVGVMSDGPSFDMVESNGYLYVGQGSGVRVYDISDRATIPAMTFTSYLAELPVGGPVRAVEIVGQYLYIGAENKLIIADIRQPNNPMIISSLDNPVTNTQIFDFVIKGNYAYLLIRSGGIQVVDISNPASPRLLTRLKLAGYNRPWRGTINGNYLYVGTGSDNRLDIIDISKPESPVVVGSYIPAITGANSTSGVAIKGNYAYITEYHNGIRAIDVSNPAHPVEVSNIMGINANDIKILGNYAYVSTRYQGINIIDISNPAGMTIVGKTTKERYYNEGIYVIPGYTFMAFESMGFGIYDTATITAPKHLVRVPVMGGADSVAVHDNTLYIGAHNDGVWNIDITDPTAPKELAMTVTGGRTRDISFQDNRVYAASEWTKLNVIDVSSKTNPLLVNKAIGGHVGTVLADGKYVYTELGIVDFTNPNAPISVSYTHLRRRRCTVK